MTGLPVDLLSFIPWDMRPVRFEEVSIPHLVSSARRRAHQALFLEGPTLAAADLHASILEELHLSYDQEWDTQIREAAVRKVVKRGVVQVGQRRDLLYRAKDLPQLLAYYGLGSAAPTNKVRRYKIRYWDLERLLFMHSKTARLDCAASPG